MFDRANTDETRRVIDELYTNANALFGESDFYKVVGHERRARLLSERADALAARAYFLESHFNL